MLRRKVSPFDALGGSTPVTGFFVAETPEAMYIAHPHPEATKSLALDHGAIALVRLPKTPLTSITVGALIEEPPRVGGQFSSLALCQVRNICPLVRRFALRAIRAAAGRFRQRARERRRLSVCHLGPVALVYPPTSTCSSITSAGGWSRSQGRRCSRRTTARPGRTPRSTADSGALSPALAAGDGSSRRSSSLTAPGSGPCTEPDHR